MKFKLVDEYLYWWPVKVKVPDQKRPGKVTTLDFEIQFEALPQDKAEEIDAAFALLTTDEDRAKHQHDVLYRACRDWRGVDDGHGEDAPFTPDSFASAMRWSWFRTALYVAYGESIRGEPGRGN